MNKRKALELLTEYLKECGSDFYFHKEFILELQDIILHNAIGHERELFHLLVKQLGFVKTMGEQVHKADSNEILKNTGKEKDYYSLHIQDKIVNVRLLMTFTDSHNPVFLAAFYERTGKKASDYSKWETVIKERYDQIGR